MIMIYIKLELVDFPIFINKYVKYLTKVQYFSLQQVNFE